MNSPLRRTNSRSSPSRLTPSAGRRSQPNSYHSPLRTSSDSPSRLIEEFSKVYIDGERAFRTKLDEQDDERERLHKEALTKALKEHEEIRQGAERAREILELTLERIRVEKAEEERIALERERQQAAEAEAAARQRELDAVKRREEALQQAAQKQRELEEAQWRIDAQRKQEAEDKAKRDAERAKEEADTKARHEADTKEREAAAAEAARKAAQPAPSTTQSQSQPPSTQPQTNGTAAPMPSATQPSKATISPKSTHGVLVPKGIVTPAQEREAEHKRFLDLHKQLKVMRNDTLEQAKTLGLKNQLGDMRREIKKAMGQLNKVDKTANRDAVSFDELI
jgi:nucleoporin GLE1